MIRVVEYQAKLTLGDISSCFLGVPKNKYSVFKDNGNIYVWTATNMHKYWYAMEKFFRLYDVETYNGFTIEKSDDFVKNYLSMFGGTLYKVNGANIL